MNQAQYLHDMITYRAIARADKEVIRRTRQLVRHIQPLSSTLHPIQANEYFLKVLALLEREATK